MGKQHANMICKLRRTRDGGFTLLELVVTLAVAAILLGVAIPSYRSTVQRNAMVANVNDLVGDLNYARSQAVTRGQRVHICKSSDGSSCAKSGDWSQGWIVFTPDPSKTSSVPTDDNRLRIRGALDGQVTIKGFNDPIKEIAFDANGFTTDFDSYRATADTTTRDTKVVISRSGRIRTEHVAKGSS